MSNIKDERWEKWSLDYNIEIKPKYFIHGILDDLNGLRVYLCDFYGDSSITILFSGFVYSYRYNEEQAILRTLSEVSAKFGRDFLSTWTFFVVHNSRYAEQIDFTSQGIYSAKDLIHFNIVDGDGVLEVITDAYPQIVEGWSQQKAIL